jgi:hypothetical protein
MNQPTINSTIFSFAFSGMLGAHRREYGLPPPPSATPATAKKK